MSASDMSNRQWGIWLAARRGDTEAVSEIVNGGTPVDIQNVNAETALHLAAMNGHVETVRFLLKKNAFVNAADKVRLSPSSSLLSLFLTLHLLFPSKTHYINQH